MEGIPIGASSYALTLLCDLMSQTLRQKQCMLTAKERNPHPAQRMHGDRFANIFMFILIHYEFMARSHGGRTPMLILEMRN
jgi:hypothetical protein